MRRRSGVPLIVLILVGLGLSAAALVLLGAFFSWLSLGTTYPWELDPRPSQDAQFGIVRNAVTAGAALGLGITLLLSYRRQKTNEQSQDIAARALSVSASAQETAAEALQLANKQHGLDVERRHDDSIRELHARYSRCAEQLGHVEVAVRLAGVYAAAALADDWYMHHEEDQRQACLDLLCSYYRIPGRDVDMQGSVSPVREAIWSTVLSRMSDRCPELKRWTSTRLDFRNLPDATNRLNGLLLEGGYLDLSGSNFPRGLTVSSCEVRGGTLAIKGIKSPTTPILFQRVQLVNGTISADFDRASPEMALRFSSCVFDGGQVVILLLTKWVRFDDCMFRGSEIDFSWGINLEKVEFVNCKFFSDIGRRTMDAYDPSDWLKGVDVLVQDCTFEEGVPVLYSRRRSG